MCVGKNYFFLFLLQVTGKLPTEQGAFHITWALRINNTLNMMSDNQQTVIIIRQHKGIGIDSKLNGWNLETETMLDKKYYNGRICFQVGNKRVGLTTLRKEHPCKIIIPSTIPF